MAAYLAHMDMFFHIVSMEREVYWQIGAVCCSAYPIEQLDTINSSTGTKYHCISCSSYKLFKSGFK